MYVVMLTVVSIPVAVALGTMGVDLIRRALTNDRSETPPSLGA